jgi:hypothetical protein
MQRINACRMYLRVTRLSDIASADGKTYVKIACKGIKRTPSAPK